MRRLMILASSAAVLAACGADIASTEDFAKDTFAKPTHHGELDFDGSNTARFTSNARFHGWSFTLSGDATVELGTALRTPNLDTMMYLYEADADGKKQGASIAKDDNGGDDGLASVIEKDLSAGTYFVQIKTKNVSMRGDFELEASCVGAGCPVDAPPSPMDYCHGAHESIGKCMDDGYEESECAPSDSDAILCCNAYEQDEWFCEDLCIDGELDIARVWNDDYDALYGVFPEDEFSGLVDAYAFAVNVCASPSLDDLAKRIADGTDLVEDEAFEPEPWIDRSSPEFFGWTIDEDIVSVLDQAVGENAAARFEASVEVPCPNCTDGYTIHGFYYPNVGKAVVLEQRWGGDS